MLVGTSRGLARMACRARHGKVYLIRPTKERVVAPGDYGMIGYIFARLICVLALGWGFRHNYDTADGNGQGVFGGWLPMRIH
jgi:hypothetical protein